jgi:hypothetical protein
MVAVALVIEPVRAKARLFYVWMAAVCALVAFAGFAPTYWLQLPAGTFVGSPLVHIHGALFSIWTLLLLSQTLLVANGRLNNHRAWGLAGISLATSMVGFGMAAAIQTLTAGLATGYGDHSRAFMILPVSVISLFAGFFIAAIANLQHPEAHKRLMLLATISLLQAVMGRVFFVLVTGGGPGAQAGARATTPIGHRPRAEPAHRTVDCRRRCLRLAHATPASFRLAHRCGRHDGGHSASRAFEWHAGLAVVR